MKCSRCGSVMSYEKFFHQTEYFWGWKCVFCGEYIDQVIWENRQYQNRTQDNSRKKREKSVNRSRLDTPSELSRT